MNHQAETGSSANLLSESLAKQKGRPHWVSYLFVLHRCGRLREIDRMAQMWQREQSARSGPSSLSGIKELLPIGRMLNSPLWWDLYLTTDFEDLTAWIHQNVNFYCVRRKGLNSGSRWYIETEICPAASFTRKEEMQQVRGPLGSRDVYRNFITSTYLSSTSALPTQSGYVHWPE